MSDLGTVLLAVRNVLKRFAKFIDIRTRSERFSIIFVRVLEPESTDSEIKTSENFEPKVGNLESFLYLLNFPDRFERFSNYKSNVNGRESLKSVKFVDQTKLNSSTRLRLSLII